MRVSTSTAAWTVAAAVVALAACGGPRAPVAPDPAALGPLDPAVKALVVELTTAVTAAPSDADRWSRLGMAFEANGFLPAAADAYATAVRLSDTDPRARYRLAVLHARRGDAAEALAGIDAVIALAPDYLPARWRRGLWLLDTGETDAAEAAFRTALKMAPDDPGGAIGMALVQLARRQDAEAAATLEAVLARIPGDRYAQHLLGTAYQRLGRDAEARFALTVGAMGEPNWADPWSDEVLTFRRGFAALLKEATRLGLERRFDEAIALLRQLTADRPGDEALRIYLGGMYASAGRISDAARILDPILAAQPGQFDATMHLATGYLFAGALDQAAVYATRALALRPESADAAKLRGMINWQQGRTREAGGFFEAAAAADPRDPMPHLWMGMILGQVGKYPAARARFETALSKNPLLGDALIGIADTYAATGAFADARAALQRAEQAEPANPRLAAARDRIGTAARSAR